MADEVIQIEGKLEENSREAELIKNAVSGNHTAFRDLYDDNIGKVYALCLRMTADVDEAEELSQEVFIKAWKNLQSFRYASKFSTWLHRIAVNEFLTKKRNSKRNAEKISNAAAEWEVTMSSSYSFSSTRDITMDLEKAITKLPEQQRIAFMLHDVEGYQHNEISKMINISEGTSKSNLHRARKFLRGILKSEKQYRSEVKKI